MIKLEDWSSEDLASQHRAIGTHMNEIHTLVEALNDNYSEDSADYFTDELHDIQSEIITALGKKKINEELEKVKDLDQQENK